MKVKARVVYPIDLSIEVVDGSDHDAIWKSVILAADNELKKGQTAPVILQCDDLIESTNHAPDTQAEWLEAALISLQKSKEDLHYAISVRALIPDSVSNKISLIDKELDEAISSLISSSKK